MKLKFIEQQYQTDAVNAICDIFDGCEIKDSLFTIDASQDTGMALGQEGYDYFIGHANKLSISDDTILDNIRTIQIKNDIQKSNSLNGKNFTIEMETGT